MYGLGMMPRALGEHAHVQPVDVVRPVGLVRRALLPRDVLHALADQRFGLRDAVPAPRPAPWPRTGGCGRRAWRRCRRRKTRGRRRRKRACSVAVMRSGESPTYSAQASCRPRAASSSMSLGMCLSARLPERISSPTMTRPISVAAQAGWMLASSANANGGGAGVGRGAAARRLGAELLQRRQAVVGEPERGEREHQRVDPDRQRAPGSRKPRRTTRPEAQTMLGAAPR